jgi:hypothetical protein
MKILVILLLGFVLSGCDNQRSITELSVKLEDTERALSKCRERSSALNRCINNWVYSRSYSETSDGEGSFWIRTEDQCFSEGEAQEYFKKKWQ